MLRDLILEEFLNKKFLLQLEKFLMIDIKV
jgi:hypothetical protein